MKLTIKSSTSTVLEFSGGNALVASAGKKAKLLLPEGYQVHIQESLVPEFSLDDRYLVAFSRKTPKAAFVMVDQNFKQVLVVNLATDHETYQTQILESFDKDADYKKGITLWAELIQELYENKEEYPTVNKAIGLIALASTLMSFSKLSAELTSFYNLAKEKVKKLFSDAGAEISLAENVDTVKPE